MEPIPANIQERYKKAAASGKKLRYVASVDAEGNAVVGLQEVGPESPLYSLRGTDNAILTTPPPCSSRVAPVPKQSQGHRILHSVRYSGAGTQPKMTPVSFMLGAGAIGRGRPVILSCHINVRQ